MGKIKWQTAKNITIKKALFLAIVLSLITAILLSVLTIVAVRSIRDSISWPEKEILDYALYFLIILYTVLSIVGGVFIFYRIKLQKPINLLMNSSKRISENDLDFSIHYSAKDEMGMLCDSFEKMKNELAKNNSHMWLMAEERKKLNAAFAHDLRTPLTVLRGYTDFLSAYIPSSESKPEKVLSTVEVMAQNIKRIENYVDVMNSIQKLEDTPINLRKVNVDNFIKILTENTNKVASGYNKTLVLKNNMSQSHIFVDEDIVFRVLDNITINALQYALTNVTIQSFLQDNMLVFEITDDGSGFSEVDIKNALNPFYRGEKSTEKIHFGLGLCICKTLCHIHGGNIKVSNNEKSGAKVLVTFLSEVDK